MIILIKRLTFKENIYISLKNLTNSVNSIYNNNNSYAFMISIKSIHEEYLYYVCWVNKTLWGRKSLAIYMITSRSQNDEIETMYQICLRWLHVKE